MTLLLVLAACGMPPEPTVPPHGLEVEPLEHEPRGMAYDIGPALAPGLWIAEVDVELSISEAGEPPRDGRARFEIRQEVRREAGVLRSHVALRLLSEPDPVARLFHRGLDGLRIVVTHDARGRVVPESLRFESRAVADAPAFFEGLMMAGFAGSRAWVPPEPVRLGERWERERLGVGEASVPRGAEVPTPRTRGGARLAYADLDEEGEAHFVVELDGLVEVDGPMTQRGQVAAISLGIRSQGRAVLGANGLPFEWEVEEETRFHFAGPDENSEKRLRIHARGVVRKADPSDR